MIKLKHTDLRQGQTLVAAVIALGVIIIILMFSLFTSLRQTTSQSKTAYESEAAYWAAESAVEEAVLQLRTAANNDTENKYYKFLRSEKNSRVEIDTKTAARLFSEIYGGNFGSVTACAIIEELEPLTDDLIENSADKKGQLAVYSTALIGRKTVNMKVTLQFRLLDMRVPEPLCKYDVVCRLEDSLFGINQNKTEGPELTRLPEENLETINKKWVWEYKNNQKTEKLTGFPYVYERVCREFPTWNDMVSYSTWNGKLHFCGDIFSPDTSMLSFTGSTINGFGRIFAYHAPININNVSFTENSAIAFGGMNKCSIRLKHLPANSNARFSIFMPDGRVSADNTVKFKGHVYMGKDDTDSSSDILESDESRSEQKIMAAISGHYVSVTVY